MKTIQIFLRSLPWLIVLGLIFWITIAQEEDVPEVRSVNRSVILQEVEKLGKLELVRYNFKEITELTELSEEFLKIFKLGPDSKIALISAGEAVGCLDLEKLEDNDISVSTDTVFVQLPEPEICYYKLDMEKTYIYSIQTNPLKDEGEFIQRAYRMAEQEVKTAALASGILEQTTTNAAILLKPLFEKVTGKVVVFRQQPKSVNLELN